MIEREGLEDREKIAHLIASLKDAEAKDVVAHSAAQGNYAEVVAALKRRYDKKRVVYMSHVNALQARKPVTRSYEDVVQCKRDLDLHYDGMKAYEGSSIW